MNYDSKKEYKKLLLSKPTSRTNWLPVFFPNLPALPIHFTSLSVFASGLSLHIYKTSANKYLFSLNLLFFPLFSACFEDKFLELNLGPAQELIQVNFIGWQHCRRSWSIMSSWFWIFAACHSPFLFSGARQLSKSHKKSLHHMKYERLVIVMHIHKIQVTVLSRGLSVPDA